VPAPCNGQGDCDDGFFCNGPEQCLNGFCSPSAGPSCNDGIACTSDSCDEAADSCAHAPIDASCQDGAFCNGQERCDDVLGCVDGPDPFCDDDVPCTIGSCNEAQDRCELFFDDAACADGQFCNGGEQCTLLGCRPGTAVACDDLIGCTDDFCDELNDRCDATGVEARCSDGLACSGVEVCDEAFGCRPGNPTNCNDGLACTVDSCDEAAGGACQSTADHGLCPPGQVCDPPAGCVPGQVCVVDGDCDDGILCNGVEDCGVDGICAGGSAPNCNDGIACTRDSCSELAGGCVHLLPDVDADTYFDEACGGDDCDDGDPSIHPGATETCDGLDEDCDGLVDEGFGALGEACQDDGDCCSERCVRGFCTTDLGTCLNPGQECVTPADCCSGVCEVDLAGDTVCQPGGSCAPAGDACAVAVDCCSLACVPDGNGGHVCSDQPGDVCEPEGGACLDDAGCCSNDCQNNGVCDDAGPGCSVAGELCGGGQGSCCSQNCVDVGNGEARCDHTQRCRAEGEICVAGNDCCSGACDDGRCADLGACKIVGEPCTGVRDCCSNACADPGTGSPVCQFLSGCRPIGEICSANDQCCSNECVLSDHDLVMRCNNPPGCLDRGEVCFVGASNNCCPGGGQGLCLPTIAGVNRCYGQLECLDDGVECAFGDECCCGLCAIDPIGPETCECDIPCIPLGGSCAADVDCCSGTCIDGICDDPDTGCQPLGGACDAPSDCCSGVCFNGFCSINVDG